MGNTSKHGRLFWKSCVGFSSVGLQLKFWKRGEFTNVCVQFYHYYTIVIFPILDNILAEPVFGSGLIEICTREKSNVPKFIRVCTALVEEKGTPTKPLSVLHYFSLIGRHFQVWTTTGFTAWAAICRRCRKFAARWTKVCEISWEQNWHVGESISCSDKYALLQTETDVHVLTGALKLFFRELPNALFPVEMTKDFLSAISEQKIYILTGHLLMLKFSTQNCKTCAPDWNASASCCLKCRWCIATLSSGYLDTCWGE